MSWKAIHPGHAIEKARLVISFSDRIPPRFAKSMASSFEGIRSSLNFTQLDMNEGQEFQLGPQGVLHQSNSTPVLGWVAQRCPRPGFSVESLRLEPESLTYETAVYSRWTEFKKRFASVAKPSVEMATSVANLQAVNLEYVDRFVFSGDISKANPVELFPNLGTMLPDSVTSGQELWHLHRGWFEQVDGVKLLINNNLDAQEGKTQDNQVLRSVQVFTKVQFSILQPEVEFDSLAPIFEVMHDKALAVMSSVLSESVCKEIGIKT